MSEHVEHKSPEQIQRDIQRTRAGVDATLETIRSKLSPGEMLDEALNYFKSSGSGQFTSNLGETVRDNPLPVALIGAGIGWLMMGGSRNTHRSSTWTSTDNTHSSTGEKVGSATAKTGQMMQGVRERAGGARERMGDMAHGVQERLGETRERMGDMAHGAQERLGNATERARYQARHQTERAKNTFDYLLTEQPLILGVLGFALGAALGVGLPPTHREDELMGETRDEYVRKAREVGEEQLEKAKQVATAASEAAKDQAEREGLTPGSADQRLREAGDKAERVLQASREAAKEEANKQGLTSSSG